MARGEVKRQMGVALSDDLRDRLEKSAEAAGHSVGEEIRQRLERTFAQDQIDAPTKAMMEAVQRLASLVSIQTMQNWYSHPAAARVFSRAITARLERLEMKCVLDGGGAVFDDAVFQPGELPTVLIVNTDKPDEMGLGLEAIDFHSPQMGKQLAGHRRTGTSHE